MLSKHRKRFYPSNTAENLQYIHLEALHNEPSSPHNLTRSASKLLSSQSDISHDTIQAGSLEYSNGSEVSESDLVPRHITRTPSPTPSEIEVLTEKNPFSPRKHLKPENLFKKETIIPLVFISVGLTLTILSSIYDKQIVAWFEPAARKIHLLPAGFLIPIAILVVISFPLFGQGLIELLCGLVYGAGIGFAVSACGVLLGEIVIFLTSKHICAKRGKKLEQTNIKYGSFAQIIREGGFLIAIIIRYSAVPDHYATAVFATAGMNMLVFLMAAVLSLPKQFLNVYVGSVLALADEGDESAAQIKKNNLIETVVLVASIAITIIAMRYINAKLNKAKVDVIYKRRKNRQEKLERAETRDTVVEVAADKDYPPHTILAPIPLPISTLRNIAEDQVR